MISPETIAAIKERVDIVALVGEHVQLRRQGRRFVGRCPFHAEKTPSFSVNPEARFFHCFGCRESGTAIDFVMKLEGQSFPEAVRSLAARAGVVVDETGSRADIDAATRRQREREELTRLLALVAGFYEAALGAGPSGGHPLAHHARRELDRRALSPTSSDERVREALAAFRIGYAPYGWDTLARWLDKQGLSLRAAEELGLVRARPSGDGHYDMFRHRLMFPVIDHAGRVVGFSGRALAEPEAEELARLGIAPMTRASAEEEGERRVPKYTNSPESPVYVKGATLFGLHQARAAIRQKEVAILVEGNFDVLSLHARGVTNVVAPLGTAFTVEQAKLVGRFAPSLVALFDGDAAGRKAAVAMRLVVREVGLGAKVAVLPAGTDPDELARARGAEAVEAVVREARGLLEYLIEEALSGEAARGASLRDKQERIQRVLGYLAEERDPNVRQMAKMFADKLSAQLIVAGQPPGDIRALERAVERALASAGQPAGLSGGRPHPAHAARPASGGANHPIELAILGALVEYPDLFADGEVEEALGAVEGAAALGIAAVRQMWEGKKSLDPAELLDLMPAAIQEFAVGRLACPEYGERGEARRELLENTRKLRRLSFRDDKELKLQEIAAAERLGDREAEEELLRELSRRSKEKLGLS
jgi:DNA primase